MEPESPTLFRNTVAATAGTAVAFVTSIALAPVMIGRLGLSTFGIWAVTGAVAAYVGLLDLGVTIALRRFIALYEANGDERARREVVGLGLAVVTLLAALAVPAALLLGPAIGDALNAPATIDMRVVVVAATVDFVCLLYARVLSAVPEGFNRMVASNVALGFGQLVNFGLSLAALLASRDLAVYAVANAIAGVVSVAAMAVAARYVAGPRLFAWPGREIRRTLVRYAIASQARWLALLVNQQTDKVVLALLVDTRTAGLFEVANRVALATAAVGALSVSAFIPRLTRDLVRRGRAVVREVYLTYTTRMGAVAFPVYVVTVVVAPYLLRAWIGDASARAVATVEVLSLAYLAANASGVASSICDADGRPWLAARAIVISAVVNALLTVALAPIFGFAGVLAGTGVAIVLIPLVIFHGFHREYGFRRAETAAALWRPACLAIGAGIPLGLLGHLLFDAGMPRPAALGVVAGLAAAYVALYWPIATYWALLPERLALPMVSRRRPLRSPSSI